MASFEKSIDVDVPVAEAYMMFSDFESFPSFMEGVESVERLSGDRLRWHANIAGRDEEWIAEITEQAPSNAVAWRSVSGSQNHGRVTFDRLSDDRTRVNLHIEYEPEGFVENVGTMLGVVNGRMDGDLKRFKELVENGPVRSGWRARDGSTEEITAAEADGSVDEVTASDMMDGGQRRQARIQRDHDPRDSELRRD